MVTIFWLLVGFSEWRKELVGEILRLCMGFSSEGRRGETGSFGWLFPTERGMTAAKWRLEE